MTEINGREPWVEATEYTVCVVPRRYPDWRTWAVTVTQLGNGQWRVTAPTPLHPLTFDSRDEAIADASDQAAIVRRNGMTGTDYIARYNATHGDPKETQ